MRPVAAVGDRGFVPGNDGKELCKAILDKIYDGVYFGPASLSF